MFAVFPMYEVWAFSAWYMVPLFFDNREDDDDGHSHDDVSDDVDFTGKMGIILIFLKMKKW